jgi:S1-C subfamily serine protease
MQRSKIIQNLHYLVGSIVLSVWFCLSVQAEDYSNQIEALLDENQSSGTFALLSSGSGFVINPNGHIVTNYHVIDGCNFIAKINDDINTLRVVAVDDKLDLAILKSSESFTSYLSISGEEAGLTEDIFVAGFPLGSDLGEAVKVTKGIISSVIGGYNPTQFQFDAAISGGNSGGPIVRPHGVVVGVAVSTWKQRKVGDSQNINFGIKVQSLARFLDHFAIPFSSHTVFDEKNIDLATHLTANTIHIGCYGDPKTMRLVLMNINECLVNTSAPVV